MHEEQITGIRQYDFLDLRPLTVACSAQPYGLSYLKEVVS